METIQDLWQHTNLGLLLMMALFAFFAGFIDAVAGGGGLIQIPALLINFPKVDLPTLFGTNKIASICGTLVASVKFANKIQFNWLLLASYSITAIVFSYIGVSLVSQIDIVYLRPIVLIILVMTFIYSLIKKEFGNKITKTLSFQRQLLYGIVIAGVVGFYDGFFGPGAGSFLIVGMILILGFDFLTASGYAKIINFFSNFTAMIIFVNEGKFMPFYAIPMALCNTTGGWVGANLAISKGNNFIRYVFLLVVLILILRYGYDIFYIKTH